MSRHSWFVLLLSTSLLLSACSNNPASKSSGGLQVLAAETFLADIAQNVAGDRLKVDSLLPPGADPHSFEPSPADVTRVARSQVLIVNGAGYEQFINKLLSNAGGHRPVIEASAGLTPRMPAAGENPGADQAADPHFWVDPNNVIQYVKDIQAGLSMADPQGAAVYQANADTYIARLKDLDAWISSQVSQVPAERRLLVTNHESLGYFADRYGFKIIGSLIPSVSSEASPSAQQLAALVDQVRSTHAPAVFLDAGSNQQLAEQLAQETGVKIVNDLYVESLTGPNGPAPTYLDMIKHDTEEIVKALQ